MAKLPAAVWIVDTKKEHLAVAEANKLNIPIVAILDTNCDPDEVTYASPATTMPSAPSPCSPALSLTLWQTVC